MSLASILPKGYAASTYTAQAHTGDKDFKPLPAGLYTAEVTGAEVRPLKSGKGTGLTLEFTIIDPAPHARRKIFQTLNIQHSSEKAQEIALRDLTSLFRAVGVETATEDDLFGKVLRIRTKITPANDGYPEKAEVAGYEAAGTKAPAPGRPPAPIKPPPTWPQEKPGTAFDNMDSDIPY